MSQTNRRLIIQALKKKRGKIRFPRPRAPKHLERSYQRDLREMMSKAHQLISERLVPRLSNIVSSAYQHHPEAARKDAADDAASEAKRVMNQVRETFAQEYSPAEIKRIAAKKGVSVSQYNREVLERGLKRVTGVDILLDEPYLAGELELFAIGNANLIQSIPSRYFDEIENLVYTGLTTGTRVEELADDIEDRYGVSESRARLIARDQTSKLNGQLTRLRQSELGIEKYTWRTSLDERVRESHQVLEGKVFTWDNPPSVGHPGEDFQCRCTAEPFLDDLLDE